MYFANCIQAWKNLSSYIVWVDDNGLAYDIEGPYIPEDNECDRLTDISFLGEAIIDFMHVPGKYYHAPKKLHKWAKSQNMTDIYALTSLFRDIPKEKIDYQKNITFNVYQYWKENVIG